MQHYKDTRIALIGASISSVQATPTSRVGPACQTLEENLILLKYQFKSKTFAKKTTTKKKTWKTKPKVSEPPSKIKKGQF